MKKQLLVLGVLVLFFGLTLNPVVAEYAPENKIEEEKITVGYSMVNNDGSVANEIITLTKSELSELQTNLNILMSQIETAEDSRDLDKIVNTLAYQGGFFGLNHPILQWILNFLSFYKLPRTRSLVISQGHGYKLNIFRNHKIDFYRPLTVWQYADQWGFDLPDKTLVLKRTPLNLKIMHGSQIGIMTHFFGLYIFVSQPNPQKCWTFFIGSARRVVGIDFTLSPFM